MHRLAILALPLLASFFAGCARTPVEHTVRKIPADTSGEAQQTRSQVEGVLKASLEKLEEDIRELKMRAERLEQSARAKLAEEVAELDAKQQAARATLDAMAKATDEAWTSLREGAENAWDELEKAVRKARSRFFEPEGR